MGLSSTAVVIGPNLHFPHPCDLPDMYIFVSIDTLHIYIYIYIYINIRPTLTSRLESLGMLRMIIAFLDSSYGCGKGLNLELQATFWYRIPL